MVEMTKLDLTTNEVARALCLQTATVYHLLRCKQLIGHKIGRHWRIPASALIEYQRARLLAKKASSAQNKNQRPASPQQPPVPSLDFDALMFANKHALAKNDREFRQRLEELKQFAQGIRLIPLEATKREYLC